MTRSDIISKFRTENPEITIRVITDALLHDWCLNADKEICAITRCIVDQDGTTISTAEDDKYYDLIDKIENFYDIDDYPGSGVTYKGKRIEKTTMAQLDEKSPNWRGRSSGTPTGWYRRGKYLYLDKPVGSAAEDVVIYSVLVSDDFDNDNITPYNQLSYLEPFHDGINKYLQWRGMGKIGKEKEGMLAKQEFYEYAQFMKRMVTGGKVSAIQFKPIR